ncbi:MAG: polynucleotide adenylyltransferase PcnB [Thermoanaerobaculia bacterium]
MRPRAEHTISRSRIDPDALKVLYRLRGAGHKAYLVGGSVRDLLLNRVPKDFDIGTDAQPSALRKLFRNCRMIGRRFRLAHILFADGKVVEVATFRRPPDPAAAGGGQELLQTSDNTFGTPREDALRRDFTINGLFYDISDFSVVDYVGGLDDLEAGLVRTIGDPEIRFQEDPVRMMRAVEFASRLGFAITPDSYEAILRHRKEIVKSAPPRVTEELAQALRGGHALPTLLLMREVGLLDALLPELATALRQIDPDHARGTGHLFWALLEVLDAERRRGRVFGDAVLFALLFIPIVRGRVREAFPDRDPDPNRLSTIIEEVVSPLAFRMSLPRAATDRIKQALAIVGKLSHRPDAKVATRRLAFRDAFSTALDLFELTAMATGRGQELVRDWRALQARVERARAAGEIPAAPAPPPRRRRRGRGVRS